MAALAALSAAACIAPAPAGAESTWRLEQPAPPAGAPFAVPLGPPGDLRFFGPGRGLLAIEGNSAVARGLYFYDGARWRQLATVCGGPADTARVAWAGPTEFWTVTEPSRPRAGSGTALCHFKDGIVVGSYSTADSAADPYRQMSSAVCNGPNDCWFGGIGSQDALGQRVGAFHLHWDGIDVRTVYGPQGRGVSAMTVFGGRFFETTYVGRSRENTSDPVDLAQPEVPGPRLLHSIDAAGAFRNEAYVAADRPGVPDDGTELLTVDSDGTNIWAGGAGASSGPAPPPDGIVERPPIAIRRSGDFWQEVALDESQFRTADRITAITPMSGSGDAIAAVSTFAERRSTTAKARVARITPSGAVTIVSLPSSGAGRGSASRIACPAPEECWMVTTAGWLFHLTDGSVRPPTADPAFEAVIGQRPNEAAEQFIPDSPPVDDSLLFAPPPATAQDDAKPGDAIAPPAKAKPVIKSVGKPRRVGRTKLVISFTVLRSARIGMTGFRGKRTVARTAAKLMKPGRRTVVLKLSRKRSLYPTRLAFVVRVPGESTAAPDDGDTVTTGPGSGDTGANSGDTTAPTEPVGSGGTTIG